MPPNKYRPIVRQTKEIYDKNRNNQLPSIKPRALSLGNPKQPLRLNSLLPQPHPSSIQRQVSAVNIQTKKQTFSVKNSNSNKWGGFDNQILIQQRSKSVKKSRQLAGLSCQEMLQRRQSHLNTYFNIRKNRLQQIMKENKRIYVRINSQKSMYSNKNNNSIDSVSNSRLSHTGSRHSIDSGRKSIDSGRKSIDSGRKSIDSCRKSVKSKTNLKKAVITKQPNIKIESKDIHKLPNTEVHNYLNIFCNHLNSHKSNHTKTTIKPPQNHKDKQNNHHPDGLGKILEEMQQKRQPKKRQVFGRLL